MMAICSAFSTIRIVIRLRRHPPSPARRALRDKGREYAIEKSPLASRRALPDVPLIDTDAARSSLLDRELPPETFSDRLLAAFGGPLKPLMSLSVDEVIQMLEKLGYGRYAIGVRLNNLDGKKIVGLTAGGFGAIGVQDASVAARLHTRIAQINRHGVPYEMIKGVAYTLCGRR